MMLFEWGSGSAAAGRVRRLAIRAEVLAGKLGPVEACGTATVAIALIFQIVSGAALNAHSVLQESPHRAVVHTLASELELIARTAQTGPALTPDELVSTSAGQAHISVEALVAEGHAGAADSCGVVGVKAGVTATHTSAAGGEEPVGAAGGIGPRADTASEAIVLVSRRTAADIATAIDKEEVIGVDDAPADPADHKMAAGAVGACHSHSYSGGGLRR